MPDDRFADLGGEGSAGDRFAELDRTHPEQQGPPPPRRRRGGYTWVVGVAAVIAIIVAGFNSIPNAGRGDHGPPVGTQIPHFAAPKPFGPLDGDVNVKQSASDQTGNKTPACSVRLPGALRSCDYTSKPLVLTFILPTAACENFVDRVDRMRSRFPKVNFITVISAKKGRAEQTVRDHHWRQSVVFDRNGNLLTRYRLGLCPNVVFAYAGGKVRATQTEAEKWTDAQLAAAIRATEKR